MLKYKYPIEYEISPTEIDRGTHWIALDIKNLGDKILTKLDVRLHSMDTLCVSIKDSGHYIPELVKGERTQLVSRVEVFGSAMVYATIRGQSGGETFWWESGWTYIRAIEEKAKLERLLVLSHPYTLEGENLEVEATVKAHEDDENLVVEFWVDTPSSKYEKLAKIDIMELSAGEEAAYSAEFTPKETGQYMVMAYLYDGWRRIGYTTDTIYVRAKDEPHSLI